MNANTAFVFYNLPWTSWGWERPEQGPWLTPRLLRQWRRPTPRYTEMVWPLHPTSTSKGAINWPRFPPDNYHPLLLNKENASVIPFLLLGGEDEVTPPHQQPPREDFQKRDKRRGAKGKSSVNRIVSTGPSANAITTTDGRQHVPMNSTSFFLFFFFGCAPSKILKGHRFSLGWIYLSSIGSFFLQLSKWCPKADGPIFAVKYAGIICTSNSGKWSCRRHWSGHERIRA